MLSSSSEVVPNESKKCHNELNCGKKSNVIGECTVMFFSIGGSRSLFGWCVARHVFAKPPECHILASYQMWFGQKLLKNTKNNSKMVKNWSKTPKKRKLWILVLPEVDFTKITKSWLFYCYFWRFWAIFGQTTSGSSPKCDILEVWQKHVCNVPMWILQ